MKKFVTKRIRHETDLQEKITMKKPFFFFLFLRILEYSFAQSITKATVGIWKVTDGGRVNIRQQNLKSSR